MSSGRLPAPPEAKRERSKSELAPGAPAAIIGKTMRILTTTLGAGFALLVASYAHADEPAATPPSGTAAAPPKGNPTGINEEARRHFAAGVQLLQDPEGEKVEEAYREFRTAYDVSGSAKILGNMGFCAMRLERDGEAIEAYSRYLREVPDIDADERAQIVRDLCRVWKRIAQPRSRCAMLLKFERGGSYRKAALRGRHACEALPSAHGFR